MELHDTKSKSRDVTCDLKSTVIIRRVLSSVGALLILLETRAFGSCVLKKSGELVYERGKDSCAVAA